MVHYRKYSKQNELLPFPLNFNCTCRTRQLKSSLPWRGILHYVAYIQRQSKQIGYMNMYQSVICISNETCRPLSTRFIKKFLSIDCQEKVFQNRSWIIAFRAGVDTRENCDDSFDEISRKFLQRLDAKFREISCLALVISRNVTSPNASPPPIFTIWRIVVGNNGVIEISDAWIFGNRSRFRSNFKRTNIFTTLACEMLLAGLKFACSVAESGIFL